MSSLRIEEKFTVAAEVDRVWRFLLDPARVAGCLPGARLDGTEGEGTFTGTMKVKVGPVTTEFRGKATFVEIDEAGHRMRLTGTGDDKAGGGSARMTMEGHVLAAADGGSEVTVTADVELAGKLVRFGRGMIEGVSKQLFKQFAERARTQLAAAPPAAAAPTETAPAGEPAAAPAPSAATPVSAAAPPAPAAEPAPGPPAAPAQDAAAPAAKPEATAPPTAALATAAPPALGPPAPHELTSPAPHALTSPAPHELTSPAPHELTSPAPHELTSPAPHALTSPAPHALTSPAPSALAPAAPTALTPPAPAALAPAKKDDEVLDAGALIWTVLWERITRFFRRLFGRGG